MRSNIVVLALSSSLLLAAATARDIPENIKKLRETIIARGDCEKKLASGFRTISSDENTGSYCGDMLDSAGIIYQQMAGGQLSDMDIDCDGQQGDRKEDDGRCSSSVDTQSMTSFVDIIKSYNVGIPDLNPFVHSFVVFGNEGKPGWPEFRPNRITTKNGKKIEPLSVMAVVCGDKMFYGVWGDENGPDGDHPMIGEAGIGLATACYGPSEVSGNVGHATNDVLYLAFTGEDAVPGAKGANWGASSFEEFEASLHAIGDALIERIDGSVPAKPSSDAAHKASTGTEKIRRAQPRRLLSRQNQATSCGNGTKCVDSDCCGSRQHKYCGVPQGHCAAGCQKEFGRCDDDVAAAEGATGAKDPQPAENKSVATDGATVTYAKEAEQSRDSLKMETSGGTKDNGDMGEKLKENKPKENKPKDDKPKDDKPKDDKPKDDKPKDNKAFVPGPQKPRPDGSMDSLKMETGPGIKDNGDMGEKKPDDKKPDDKEPPQLSPQGFKIIDPMAKDYNTWEKGLEGNGKPDGATKSPQGFDVVDPMAKDYNKWDKGLEEIGKPVVKSGAKSDGKPEWPKQDNKEAEKKKEEADKKKKDEFKQTILPITKRPEIEGFMK